MIWVEGRIVHDDELKISALDRTFEHGLGLFETLRTWNGRALLLGRHLARLTRSARELGLPLDPSSLPDQDAVSALRESEPVVGDALVRITLTGGLSETKGATLWMRTAPLPPPDRPEGATVAVGFWDVSRSDPLARYKTLNYWLRRMASEQGRQVIFDEVLSMSPDGSHWEGSKTNLFLVRGDRLITPTSAGPIVPGVMRELVLELAEDLPIEVDEAEAVSDLDLRSAQEIFLTNSVRGIIPVARAFGIEGESGMRWSGATPGRWTQMLAIMVSDRVRQEESSS